MRSKLYTRTGDKGETSLADGKRVKKFCPRVEAYGEVDEANSCIGAARAFVDDPLLDHILAFVQHRLFNVSSSLATPPDAPFAPPHVTEEDIAALERAIDRFEAKTGALRSFILPGGSKAAGLLHLARTVCRRAERRMTLLAESEQVEETLLRFVNRASDLLFAAARYANALEGRTDPAWEKIGFGLELETDGDEETNRA